MSKRGNGEGTIGKRTDGRWEARYTDREGKRRPIYTRTRQEAQERLREALRARDRGYSPPSARETVGSYLTAWLEGTKLTVRPRTHESYRQLVRDHLVPHLGRVRLEHLRPQQIRRLYAQLADAGLSVKTIRNVHVCLHRALEQAVEDRVLVANVAGSVKPPRLVRADMQALTPDQARQVLQVAREDPLEALWVVAITAGLRLGELLALRWQDIDLHRGRLQVTATLVNRSEGEPGRRRVERAEPKTKRSRRQVELTDTAVAALRRHREHQLAAGVLPAAFVFARPDGRPMSHQQVYERWQHLARSAEVPPVRFHDLRHTAATLMLSRGVHPKFVSEMLGHATVAITLDTYSHVTPAMHREAARVMDDLLGGGG